MKHWTEIKTALRMSAIEKAYAAACGQHKQSPRGTVNEVRLMLAEKFGSTRTKSELMAAIEADFQ